MSLVARRVRELRLGLIPHCIFRDAVGPESELMLGVLPGGDGFDAGEGGWEKTTSVVDSCNLDWGRTAPSGAAGIRQQAAGCEVAVGSIPAFTEDGITIYCSAPVPVSASDFE